MSFQGFTDPEIIGQIFNLFSAGYGTTTILQVFFLYEIARNQDLQDKIRDEVHDLDLTNIQNIAPSKMPYVCATMSEVLRTYLAYTNQFNSSWLQHSSSKVDTEIGWINSTGVLFLFNYNLD